MEKKLSTKSAFAKTTESLQSNVDASGVLCLSECHDDILMWSHYGDSHRGICLEFKATNTALFGEAQRVKYAETYTDFPLLGRDTEQIQHVCAHQIESLEIRKGVANNQAQPDR